MRILAVILVLSAAFGASAGDNKTLSECRTTVTPDGTLEVRFTSRNDNCAGDMLYAVTDRYLGFECRMWGLYPIGCKMMNPTVDPSQNAIRPCPLQMTPDRATIFEWSDSRVARPAYDRCESMQGAYIRVYDIPTGQVCIMPGGPCIAFEDLTPLGKERVDRTLARAKE
jgi:hypothetical protein